MPPFDPIRDLTSKWGIVNVYVANRANQLAVLIQQDAYRDGFEVIGVSNLVVSVDQAGECSSRLNQPRTSDFWTLNVLCD